jgi:hypothetical protein
MGCQKSSPWAVGLCHFSQESERLSTFDLNGRGRRVSMSARKFLTSSADAVPHAALDWTVKRPGGRKIAGAQTWKSKEQRAKSKEQRAKSKEQRATTLRPLFFALRR